MKTNPDTPNTAFQVDYLKYSSYILSDLYSVLMRNNQNSPLFNGMKLFNAPLLLNLHLMELKLLAVVGVIFSTVRHPVSWCPLFLFTIYLLTSKSMIVFLMKKLLTCHKRQPL